MYSEFDEALHELVKARAALLRRDGMGDLCVVATTS